MTLENPEGDKSLRKFPEQKIPRKEYIGNGGVKAKTNKNKKKDDDK